jgi:gliding motility-associated-like protein
MYWQKKFGFIILFYCLGACVNAQVITTFAGNGTIGFSGDGGPAIAAQLFSPSSVCIDNAGNIYIADQQNHVVRKVNSAGIISVFAGTGVSGYSGDGGPANAAQLGIPNGLCIDNLGNIYITDDNKNVVRKVDPSGIISTVAGTGVFGYSGDDGSAINAKLFAPGGICTDNNGNIYFAEFGNQVIRKVNLSTGIITTVAGNHQLGWWGDGGPAVNASLNSPTSVSIDKEGNLYIADMGNSVIRKVNTSGIISTMAGNRTLGFGGDGGPATDASLKFPFYVYVDDKGNLYISDTGNGAIRMVDENGFINTIAGTGVSGYSGDGGPPTAAKLSSPAGIAIDNAGNIYIAEGGSNVIRKIGVCLLTSVLFNPTDATVCEGTNTSLSVSAENAISYQWQVNSGSGWVALTDNITYSGTISSTLLVSATSVGMNSNQYRCLLTNTCGGLASTAARLNVLSSKNPFISISTQTNTICAATNVLFTSQADNAGFSPFYQWKKNGVNIGTNSATYSDNTIKAGDQISCVLLSNNSCAANNITASNTIVMNVNLPLTPLITITSSGNNICSGTEVSFSASVTNEGSTPSFQWKKNGLNVGSNAPTYRDALLNNGDLLTCHLTSSQSCVTSPNANSNVITMNVQAIKTPSVVIISTANPICRGADVNFTAVAGGGSGSNFFYQWKKNGQMVGVNSSSHSENTLVDGDIISCTVTATGNCISSIPVVSNAIIMKLLKDPIISLDKSTAICSGSEKVLDPGMHKSYLWNNGSTDRQLSISSPGTYYVSVTDDNNCVADDTINIVTVLPTPKDFLPNDTAICNYGEVNLLADPGYKNYLWSTNSITRSATIKQTGIYWLKVRDANNCEGTDSIVVSPKHCLMGFFIPRAFTPNYDGKNDVFKPIILGNVKSFSFAIYNRWGQKIFETKELGKGWNGEVKGMQDKTAVFVWTCNYQFENEERKSEKGTVVLIR